MDISQHENKSGGMNKLKSGSPFPLYSETRLCNRMSYSKCILGARSCDVQWTIRLRRTGHIALVHCSGLYIHNNDDIHVW